MRPAADAERVRALARDLGRHASQPIRIYLTDGATAVTVNVELASPPDFIPALPGWRDRSAFAYREGKVDVFHFDYYSQALANSSAASSETSPTCGRCGAPT